MNRLNPIENSRFIALLVALLLVTVTTLFAVQIVDAESTNGRTTTELTNNFDCTSVAEISEAECSALVDLYESAGGADWADQTNWLQSNTPCDWAGITCIANPRGTPSRTVSEIKLDANQLTGQIPDTVSELTNLTKLDLCCNQLTNPIPESIGALTQLVELNLAYNSLDGNLPDSIGNLSELRILQVDGNELIGDIPESFANLTPIFSLGLDFNSFWVSDPTLLDYLEENDPEWDLTQTVPPADLQAVSGSTTEVQLTWSAIVYTANEGFYEVSYATDPSGPFTIHGQTASKTETSYTVDELAAGTTYYLRVRTYTAPHEGDSDQVSWDDQQNGIYSAYSEMASTATKALPTATFTSTPVPTPTIQPTSTPTPMPTPTPTTPPTGTGGDAYETDESCAQAKSIAADGAPQDHTFHVAGDTDWVRFDAIDGTKYRIEVHIPIGSDADVDMNIKQACENAPDQTWQESFAPGIRLDVTGPATGELYLQFSNEDETVAGDDVSYHVSVRPLHEDLSGALIIVAGRLELNDSLQDNIHNVTNRVYEHFEPALTRDNIHYLATDPTVPGYDSEATTANLRSAIVDWAKERIGPDNALTIYMMDHGDVDEFFIDEVNDERVTPAQLDAWLTQLETAVPGVPINVIIEACNTGTFIAGTESISKPGRTIITSTNEVNLAYASENGAYFSDHFLTALAQGNHLFGSFWQANEAVHNISTFQKPWIDANGNQIPNEEADFALARQRSTAPNRGFSSDPWPPYIPDASLPDDIVNRRGTIQAIVLDNERVDQVWAVIYPPTYTPPPSSRELVPEIQPTILLQSQGNGVYAAEYPGFDEAGTYRIVIHAEDEDDLLARPVTLEMQNGSSVLLPLIVR